MTTPRWTSTSDRYIAPGHGDAWANDAASRGRVGTQKLLAVETLTPDRRIRAALNLGDDDQVVVRRRLILEDGQPIELADSYYPAQLATGTPLAQGRKIRGGAIAVLAQLGHTPTVSTDHITADQPTDVDRQVLRVNEHEPMLVLHRLSRDANGTPVEYVITRAVARLSAGYTYQTQAVV